MTSAFQKEIESDEKRLNDIYDHIFGKYKEGFSSNEEEFASLI